MGTGHHVGTGEHMETGQHVGGCQRKEIKVMSNWFTYIHLTGVQSHDSSH